MHIEITYEDGAVETLRVDLEGERVSSGRVWIPGHEVECPSRCYFMSDFFEAALDEGHVREGAEKPDDDESPFEPFRWKLVGSEEDECRKKLAQWKQAVGPDFDPLSETLPVHDPETAAAYSRDRQCWMTYLDDPKAELEAMDGATHSAAP